MLTTRSILLIVLSSVSSSGALLGKGPQVWIFAGQSNMHPGAQFRAFAGAIREELPDVELGLIGSRQSGKPIEWWNPTSESGGPGWKQIVEQVERLEDATRVSGLVWYQGESDADSRERATSYEKNLRELIGRVRGLAEKPDLPAIIVQLASAQRTGAGQWATAYVREAQRRVAESDRRVALVTAIDLDIGDAIVHIGRDARREIGRREGLAALSVAYGKHDVRHGARLRRAFFADASRRVVLVEFEGVSGSLELVSGWKQGFALLPGLNTPGELSEWPDPAELRPIHQAVRSPIHATVVKPDRVALVFESPLEEPDRLGWAVTPNATYGAHRRWQMEFAGLTDETGITAAAFGPIAVADPDREVKLEAEELLRPGKQVDSNTSRTFDPSKAFRIGVNGIGSSPGYRLEPDEEAGAPVYRQRFWNTAVRFEPNLIDSEGRVTSVSIRTGAWYPPRTTAGDATADHKLMATQNTDERTTIAGLDPDSSYDIVLYMDVAMGPQQQGLIGYRIERSAAPTEFIWLQEPATGAGERMSFDFSGQFIEATGDNDFTGNYVVFRGVRPTTEGEIRIRGRGDKNDKKRSAKKKGFSALQIIGHGRDRETSPSSTDALRVDVRLDKALSSENPKTRPWVLSPRVRFSLEDGEARFPAIELKRGWSVPSWKGVVDTIAVERLADRLEVSLVARIDSANVVSGTFEIALDLRVDGENITGTHTTKRLGGATRRGSATGFARAEPAAVLDPGDSVWTLHLVGGLPQGKLLTVYLNLSESAITRAFAISSNFSRRPFEVDVSRLEMRDSRLVGDLVATRLDRREPDGGKRSTFGSYRVDANLSGATIRGQFEGTTVASEAVRGEIWGEARPRRGLSSPLDLWLKLEDGFSGGAMWQNRVFFRFRMQDGRFESGRAYNNKGVFDAEMTGATLEIDDDRLRGTIAALVHKSGSVRAGRYSFRIDGIRAGDVLCGRFFTSLGGEKLHSGYFVGGVDRDGRKSRE